MNHQKYKDMLQLYVYDEIIEKDKTDLENHLMECRECSGELKSLKKLYTALASNRPAPVSETILTEARRGLRLAIDEELSQPSFRKRVVNGVENLLFGGYRLVLGGSATFVIGLVMGYLLFANQSDVMQLSQINDQIDVDQLNNKNVQISNIRFNEAPSSEGDIEFRFNVTKPISYKGNVSDQFAQKLLATALLTADNPGVRIQSVNTIALQSGDSFIPDNKVKKALIASLQSDENPGVRRASINTLMKFPFDREIRDAFLFVLSNDDNSGIRVAAINALSQLKVSGTSIDDEIKNALKRNVETEENNFVRIRAASLLEEVK